MEFAVVDPSSPGAQLAMRRYFEELARRFDDGFDPQAYAQASLASGAGRFLLGTRDGAVVACGTLLPLEPRVAELKRMWVDPGVRGLGLGRQLLAALEQQAVAQGRPIVRLDTNAALTEAIALYERSGYRRIERYNDNPYAQLWFEKTLVATT